MAESLHVGLVVGPTTGGIGRHVETVASGLIERGHRVTVCAPQRAVETFMWGESGATVVATPIGSLGPGQLVEARGALRRASSGWDVVHAHGMRAGVTAAATGLHPLVVTWHNGPHDRLRLRWGHPLLERYVGRRADRVLAVSPDLTERARAAGAREPRTVAIVAPPLRPSRRPAGAVRAELGVGDRPMVMAVGRLEPQKRLDVLVDAVAGWTAGPIPAVFIAGTGSLEADLRDRIARRGAPVTLLGRRDDVAELLATADVTVLPSAWEGYPLVAQEALRAGTPLIATPVGGVPELVGDGAVLVPPGHPQALRAALEELLASAAARERQAAAGRAQAATWPSVADMVDELVDNYFDLRSRMRST